MHALLCTCEPAEVGQAARPSAASVPRTPADRPDMPRPRSRWLMLALLASVCAALGLLGPGPLPEPPPSAAAAPRMRTIVAYSLQRSLELQQRPTVPCIARMRRPPSVAAAVAWPTPGSGLFLFSAHYDRRLQRFHFARVVAMIRGSARPRIYCQLWFGGHPLVLEALRTDIWAARWDRHAGDAAYHPILLSCPVPINVTAAGLVPEAVSISLRPCDAATTVLDIPMPPDEPHRRDGFAVCVKGLDFPDRDVSVRLVEWLELNRILGANHFFVYVYSVHPNTSRVLDHYSRQGVVSVIPISLPGRQPNEPHLRSRFLKTHLWQKRRAEIVPYNDCFYHSLEKYRFVLPLDIDEVIVPVRDSSWKDMFDALFEDDPAAYDKFSSFSVRNAYFFDEFPVVDEPGVPQFLHTLRHTVRSANFSPAEDSVKSFVSTASALTVFNHYALHPLSPATSRSMVLDTAVAQMNHYKAECSPLTVPDCYNYLRYRSRDAMLLRFSKRLIDAVTPVLASLQLIT